MIRGIEVLRTPRLLQAQLRPNATYLKKVVYICDWLPPDFGAVGQYSVGFARARAANGENVLLVGLTSQEPCTNVEQVGQGSLTIKKLKATPCERSRLLRRLLWTITVNLRLVWNLLPDLRTADEIVFTGSPPFLLHLLAPLNSLLQKRLVYRITDFHPECLMAGMQRVPRWLTLFHRLTLLWRKRVTAFEVLGEDQLRRLTQIGIPRERIRLKRDPCPVEISQDTQALEIPAQLRNRVILLYSGNFGHAHDHLTFIEGYRSHHRQGSGRVVLWLNAIGAKADLVEQTLKENDLPVHRSRPVPLEDLPRLLVTPHAHLITLRDAFVGFVLPSKVYGCIESGKDILFIGSHDSDVHLLCSSNCKGTYFRADVNDVQGVAHALERLSHAIVGTQTSRPLLSPQTPQPLGSVRVPTTAILEQ